MSNRFSLSHSMTGVIGALALAALLAAPVALAQGQKVLKMIPQADLRILDPISTTAYITRNHGYMIYDTLFAIDAKFQTIADIDKPNVTVIETPGGSNERFARANFKQAKIVIYQDNVTIFDEILKGNADVMISESVETIVQQKLRPGLCAVNPDKPLQYGEMAWLLPRGDAAIKGWMDTWFHLAKASGEYDRISGRWLR